MENQEIAEGHKNVVVRDKAGRYDVGQIYVTPEQLLLTVRRDCYKLFRLLLRPMVTVKKLLLSCYILPPLVSLISGSG